MAAKVESKMIDWRHDIHENPELTNREFKTAEKVAAHLSSLAIAYLEFLTQCRDPLFEGSLQPSSYSPSGRCISSIYLYDRR